MIGSVSIVRYDDTFMFGGLYIVHPDYREMGIGRAVLRFRDEICRRTATWGLMGYSPCSQSTRNQGLCLHTGISGSKASEKVSVDKTLTPLREVPFPRILAYDSKFFPTVREGFLKHFLYQPDCKGYASITNGSLDGYGFIRKCFNGYKIGPLFAGNSQIAEKIYSALSAFADGMPVFLDVPEPNAAGMALAKAHGMTEVFGTARMYTRELPKLPVEQIFGVTTFELG